MNQKTLIGLAIAALIAIVVAVVLNQRSQPRSEGAAGSAWLAPELREHVNDVSRIVVTGAGNAVVATLERGANGWTLAEKGGYAADTGKLREFLLKLADAKLVEEKTANKDKYATLGVEDVADQGAKGLQVELDGLAQPLKLIVGNASTRGSGNFVRRVGEAQSWLASTTLSVPKSAAEWLRKDLVDVPATRIESVAITHADGKGFRVFKANEGDANFTLADIPKGREAGSEFTANGLASTLSGLNFEDVVPARDEAPGENAVKTRYAAFDGLVVDAIAWEKDGKHYAQFKASLDAAQADKGIAAAQAKAKADFETMTAAAEAARTSKEAQPEGAKDDPVKPSSIDDPAKDREDRLAAVNREIAALNAHFDGWTFVLPAYKYANIDKPLEDLLKQVEEKKPAAPAKKGGK